MKFVIYSGSAEWNKYTYKIPQELGICINMVGERSNMNLVLKILNKLTFSRKIAKFIPYNLKKIWYRYYSCSSFIGNDKVTFIFHDTNKLAQDINFHEYLKKKYPLSFFAYSMSGVYSVSFLKKYSLKSYVEEKFDSIITFDKGDSSIYGWDFSYFPYDLPKNIIDEVETESNIDLFYIGYAKKSMYPDRLEEIHQVFNFFSSRGYKCLFYIMGVQIKDQLKSSGIRYNQKISYTKSLQYILKSKAILEIVQNDQEGTTLRVQESIYLKKKLLTNNIHYLNENWFDAKNILVFKSHEEINPDFVNYKYIENDSIKSIFDYNNHFNLLNHKFDIKFKD